MFVRAVVAVGLVVGVACGSAGTATFEGDTPSALSAEQQCVHDRALLTISGGSYAKAVQQVTDGVITAQEGAYVLGELASNMSAVDMVGCAKVGQDALFMAIASRSNAYKHYAEGKTAQARADLDDETVYLGRYEAWRKAVQQATPPPTPLGATTASKAQSWSVVQIWQGDGKVAIKQTEPFTVGTEWRIDWDNRGSYLGIDIYDVATKAKIPGFVWTEGAGTDTTFMHRAGTFYLSISAGGSWKIDVQDGK